MTFVARPACLDLVLSEGTIGLGKPTLVAALPLLRFRNKPRDFRLRSDELDNHDLVRRDASLHWCEQSAY
jgi:hypothetical protein